ncbi:uncharacterized protein LOC132200607 [Neocloeon triangulifer]|uniref:uncharacterized protein LOC132200607 n=1 Tax=Neocloeon triangulifer TaxID=2078957 RepID=UPI00286F0A03|nr:uncharacterized protein LOC132200607 [Neocloeon triangulifer]
MQRQKKNNNDDDEIIVFPPPSPRPQKISQILSRAEADRESDEVHQMLRDVLDKDETRGEANSNYKSTDKFVHKVCRKLKKIDRSSLPNSLRKQEKSSFENSENSENPSEEEAVQTPPDSPECSNSNSAVSD